MASSSSCIRSRYSDSASHLVAINEDPVLYSFGYLFIFNKPKHFFEPHPFERGKKQEGTIYICGFSLYHRKPPTKMQKEVIETFWEIQDQGDYTQVVDLFADDAVLVDPFFGTFNGKSAIGEFMNKMNVEMRARKTQFIFREIDGGGDVAWAQWTAQTPGDDVEGCGLYRVKNGLMTYYKDYMNGPTGESES